MVTLGVLFEVRTKFLNIIYTSFCFKGLGINQIFVFSVKFVCEYVLIAFSFSLKSNFIFLKNIAHCNNAPYLTSIAEVRTSK
jgi:hypothetical protein